MQELYSSYYCKVSALRCSMEQVFQTGHRSNQRMDVVPVNKLGIYKYLGCVLLPSQPLCKQ